MKGKIFPESTNSCQDQAKILFNYYQQAAEKIVAEEERLEKQIAVLEEKKAQLEKEIAGLWVWFLTIILFFIYFIKKSGLMKQIADVDTRIGEFRKQHDEIFRDYKVTKLGVAYVPVAEQIKYEDRSFIVDYTGRVPESEVTLQLSRQNDLLIDTIGRLEKLSEEAPIATTWAVWNVRCVRSPIAWTTSTRRRSPCRWWPTGAITCSFSRSLPRGTCPKRRLWFRSSTRSATPKA